MDIKFSKETLKKIWGDIVSFIKGATSLPNFWAYILLSVILFIFFLFLTFPFDVLVRNMLNEQGGNLGKAVYIGEIDFNLSDSTNISSLTLILDDGSEFNFKNINMDIGLFAAVFSNELKGNLVITNLKYIKDKTSLKSVLNSEFDMEFSSYSEFPSSGEISLQLQNVELNGITIKGFDIPPIRFTIVDADLKLIKKNLSIKQLKLAGPDVSGNIKGEIVITKFAKNSRMNLNIEVDSSSPLLKNYEILLGGALAQNNKLTITVRGTIANPQVNLPQSMTREPETEDTEVEEMPENESGEEPVE